MGFLDLYEWRQRVAEMYRRRNAAMGREDPARVISEFRRAKDELMGKHLESPLDETERRSFEGLRYYPYNPDACLEADLELVADPEHLSVVTSGEAEMPMTKVGLLHFDLEEQRAQLSLYWIDVYGGGLFLPFRDATAPEHTYGGGRYLFDTVKGSDFQWLPSASGQRRLVIDFNYAYNPSCAYDYRWACPLAPRENWLPFALAAGEMKWEGSSGRVR